MSHKNHGEFVRGFSQRLSAAESIGRFGLFGMEPLKGDVKAGTILGGELPTIVKMMYI